MQFGEMLVVFGSDDSKIVNTDTFDTFPSIANPGSLGSLCAQ